MLLIRFISFVCILLSAPVCVAETDLPFEGVPDSAELVQVELGAKRLSNQTHIFTTVPEQLADLPAVAPHRGPSTSEPGPSYTVTLTRPAALYLAVHKRGQPTVPDAWKPTGLTLGWGGHEDDIYARIAQPGEVRIPEHDGKAGGYGVPHMLIVGGDLDQAKHLIDNPVARKSAIHRPARVIAVLPDPAQPGLYGHPGDTVSWKLRVIPGSDGTLPDPQKLAVSIQESDGEFKWSKDVTLDETGHSEMLSVAPPRVGYYEMTVEAGDGYDLAAFRGGVGIVPEPAAVSVSSPWGVMRVARTPFEAPLARMLGVDWVRHSNWNMVDPLPGGGVDASRYKEIADEYHAQSIHIMASISLVPGALSSRPGETSQSGDAGPLESRVAPRDWAEWQAFMRDTAAALPDIDYWEIGNEPNTPDHYWAGTVDEFADLVKYAAQGIRQANPNATILTAGFTLNPSGAPFLDRMLELDVGDYFDVLTVHSLYAKALSPDDMRAVLTKHGLPADTPVWSTEPKHVLPIRNFEAGVAKNMHFMLVNPGAYGAFQALAERDGAATKWGVAYAIASGSIADAAYVETIPTGLPDVELGLFALDGEKLLAATADEGPRGSGIRVRVGGSPIYTDLLGHTREVPADGEFVMPLDRSGVLHGASSIEVVGVEVDEQAADNDGFEVRADAATLEHGFVMRSDEAREQYAVVYQDPATSTDRPSITFPFTLDTGGTYEFFISAKWFPSHAGALISPYAWSIDGKNPTPVAGNTTTHWRRSTRTHLRFGEVDPSTDANITASQTFGKLGVVRNLQPGDHTLTIELQSPRAHDQHYSMEVEVIAGRPITDDRE